LRELLGLRKLGLKIPTVSIRPPDRNPDAMLEEERAEATRTFYVLHAGIRRIALDHLLTFLAQPGKYLSALLFAFRIGHPRGTAYSLIYFTEAIVAGAWMRRERVTHFHTHFATFVGLLITRIFPLSMSMTIHGGEEFVNPVGTLLPEKIRASAFVSTISYFAQSQMMQIIPYELWERFEVVPLGVDPDEYEAAPFRKMSELFEVSCVGRLDPLKGQHVLVDSIDRLVKAGRNVRLRLIGDGADRRSLEKHIDDLGLRASVILEGWKNQAEVRELCKQADVFALASSTEGVPVALMEAMAMQIPCIATRITGIPELIRDGIDGILVTPSDPDELAAAIARLMDDARLRQKLAAAGRVRVQEKYDIGVNVARLAAVFERRLADAGLRKSESSTF
jgi:glycosyltransferase involved in cell wall biosynthesis